MADEKITIRRSTSPEDEKRQLEQSIILKNSRTGELVTSQPRHPIRDFNPEYADKAVFKMEVIQSVESRADVIKVMGYPLLTAGLHLFDLGIKTIDSSPHAYPTEDAPDDFYAYIDIDAATLSEENINIAEELVMEGRAAYLDVSSHFYENEQPLRAYRLGFPIQRDTKAEEIDQQAVTVAKRFVRNN